MADSQASRGTKTEKEEEEEEEEEEEGRFRKTYLKLTFARTC